MFVALTCLLGRMRLLEGKLPESIFFGHVSNTGGFGGILAPRADSSTILDRIRVSGSLFDVMMREKPY
jgi:hypothetical protein